MKQACVTYLFLISVLQGYCFSYPSSSRFTGPPDRLPPRHGSIDPLPCEGSARRAVYNSRELPAQVATETDRPERFVAKDSVPGNPEGSLTGENLFKKSADPAMHGHKDGNQSQARAKASRAKHPVYVFASNNILPVESLRVALSFLFFDKVCVGMDAALLYKIQKSQQGETSEKGGLLEVYHYEQSFFSLNRNLYVFSPYAKFYIYDPYDKPGSGLYLRGGYIFTSMISGMKSDYYNKPGVPIDTLPASFIKMDPSNNRVLTTASSFKTSGFNIAVGYAGYLGQEQTHWMMDVSIGYSYLKLPSEIKQNKTVNNETYYYHMSPMWNNPINFRLFFQWSLVYRF